MTPTSTIRARRLVSATPTLLHLDKDPAHRMDVPINRQSPMQSESIDGFSLRRHLLRKGGLARREQTHSPQRNLDRDFQELDDISA